MEELQRSRGLTTGRLDARFSGFTYDLLAEYAQSDPQSDAITGAYTAAFNTYLRDELKFSLQDRKYRTVSEEAEPAWDWKHKVGENFGFPGSPNVEGDLIQAMLTNPHLQVEVENGLYDLATPFVATEYTMEHLGSARKTPEKHPSAILRRRTHDVSARRRPGQAESQRRRLHRRRREARVAQPAA